MQEEFLKLQQDLLDAMPGKQMAIDADLNAGVLTTEDAAKREMK